MTERDWEKFGELIVTKVYDAVMDYCGHVTYDKTLKCLLDLAEMGLMDLASKFVGRYGITEDHVEILSRMPRSLYGIYDRILSEMLADGIEWMRSLVENH